MSEEDTLNYIDIRCILRYRSLKSEIENTQISFQELRLLSTMISLLLAKFTECTITRITTESESLEWNMLRPKTTLINDKSITDSGK